MHGVDAFSQSCPGVAHVRGVVHLARGENQQAYDCIANGTKAIGVCAATVVATTATVAWARLLPSRVLGDQPPVRKWRLMALTRASAVVLMASFGLRAPSRVCSGL